MSLTSYRAAPPRLPPPLLSSSPSIRACYYRAAPPRDNQIKRHAADGAACRCFYSSMSPLGRASGAGRRIGQLSMPLPSGQYAISGGKPASSHRLCSNGKSRWEGRNPRFFINLSRILAKNRPCLGWLGTATGVSVTAWPQPHAPSLPMPAPP